MGSVANNSTNIAMLDLTVGTSILAISRSEDKLGIERYVERLLSWVEFGQQSWVSINTSETAYGTLYGDELCPDYETIRELFKNSSIDQYDWHDVAHMIQELMSRAPHFEACLGIPETDVNGIIIGEVETDPDVFEDCQGVHVVNDLKRCLALMAISQLARRGKLPGHALALRKAAPANIRISAQIFGESVHSVNTMVAEQGGTIFGDIMVADAPQRIVETIDESELLLHALGEDDLLAVLDIALQKQYHTTISLSDVSVGPAFFSSIQQRVQKRPELSRPIIRAIVETAVKSNMRATHALRMGKSGGTGVRTRGCDGAEAWRRDIDRDHHLHYWKVNGSIEFACISYPHDNFDIPEG